MNNQFNHKNKNNSYLHFLQIAVVLLCLPFVFFSCRNTDEKIREDKEFVKTGPDMNMKNVEIIRSDSGKVQLILTGLEMDTYESGERRIIFPKGIKIDFLKENKSLKAKLTANYAINYVDKKMMVARNNVIIINYDKGDTIYTNEFTWDQEKKKLYSNSFVKRVSASDITYGDGFESDETMDNYQIIRPRFDVTRNDE